jgi:hypothetical protein
MKSYNLLLINDGSKHGIYSNSTEEFESICDASPGKPMFIVFQKIKAGTIFRNYLSNFYSYYFNSELDMKDIVPYIQKYIRDNYVSNYLLLEINLDDEYCYTDNKQLQSFILNLKLEKEQSLKQSLEETDLVL